MRYTAPKGVFDILPSDDAGWASSFRWQYVEKILRACANDYGFYEIRTPIFEQTDLFIRSVGEGSDIVNKEMYTFTDRAERSLTLRPEGTAAVMRAYVEHNLHAKGDRHKLFYIGPMFRYERQQAGRYRQHHQFGAEAIGPSNPEQDAEIIDLAMQLYERLGIKGLRVLLNSVGNQETRERYKKGLEAFLAPRFEQLSSDSKIRYEKNMLRILDSKDPSDQALLEGCPSILDYLDEPSLKHFEMLQALLKKTGISFEICPKLVRGLDYYNKTVFEIVTDSLGAQNTIGAGGRYDGLIHSFGGPDKSAVGFATGLERILMAMIAQNISFESSPAPFVYLIGLGDNAQTKAFELLSQLRHHCIPAEMQMPSKKIQQALSKASELKASYALLLGEEELQKGVAQIKFLATRQEAEIPLADVLSKFLALKDPKTQSSTQTSIFGTVS